MIQICFTFNGAGHAIVTINGPNHFLHTYPKIQTGCDSIALIPGVYAVSIVGTSGLGGTDIDISGQQSNAVHDNVPAGQLARVFFITV